MGRTPNDDRSDALNLTIPDYWANLDDHAN